MLTIAENANNDLYRGADGNIAFLTGINALAQLCKSRIEQQRNEGLYSADQGMPTRSLAWNTYNAGGFEAAARKILIATSGVTGIQSFTITRTDNDLDYTAVINTIYGPVTIQS